MKSVDCRARRGAVLALAALPLACSIAPRMEGESTSEDFGATVGVVESVHSVAFYKGVPALADVFEHAVQPQAGDRLLIRLDGGHWVTLVDEGLQHFNPGQRVRVVSSGSVRRVEQE